MVTQTYHNDRSFNRIVFLFFAILLVWSVPLSLWADADPVILETGWNPVVLTPHMEIIKDSQRALSISDVSSPPSENGPGWFSDLPSRLSIYDSTSPHWFRFTVSNLTDETAHYFVNLGFVNVDSLSVYFPDSSGEFSSLHCGDALPFEQRPVHTRVFVIPFKTPPRSSQTYYLRIVSTTPYPFIPIMMSPEAWAASSVKSYNMFGFLYGAVIVLIFYNLFMFFSTRQRAHFYYVFFVLGLGLLTMSQIGLGFQYLWPNHPAVNQVAIPFFIGFSIFFSLLFHRSFLDTMIRTPRLDWGLKAGIAVGLGSMAYPLFGDPFNSFSLNSLWSLLATTSLIALSVYFLIALKFTPARFLVTGGVLYLLGFIFRKLTIEGILPLNTIVAWSGRLLPWLHAVFFSLALADQVNLLKKQMIRAKDESLERLQATNKLKDNILANTSHELLTPLNGIIGLSEGLITDTDNALSKRQDRSLQMIQKSGRRLAHLIGDILDFSRMRDRELLLNLEPVDLNLLVDDVLEVCRALPGAGTLSLLNEVPADLPCVLADESRLQQILFNLIGNAIKFTDEGNVTVHADSQGERLKISVSDTGIGISADNREMIFDSFQQVDPSISRDHGGAGLGLSITRKLVELHGGTLEIESELGAGTTIFFHLAAARESAAAPRVRTSQVVSGDLDMAPRSVPTPVSSPDMPLPQGGRTILIVDDEPINLEILEDFLVREGYQVLAAGDGPMALQLFQEIQPDLVVLDLMMPKMSGYEVCRKIRETEDATILPILILTARKAEDDLAPAFSCGANDFLSKPFRRKELVARVSNLIKIREINEVKQAMAFWEDEAEKRQQSAQHLFSLLDSVDKGMIAIDQDLQVSYMNPAARKMFQLEETEISGLGAEDLFGQKSMFPPDLKSGWLFSRGKVGEKVQHDFVRFQKKDGTRLDANMVTSVVHHEKNSTLVMIIHPIGHPQALVHEGADLRVFCVQIMSLALEIWEAHGHGDRIGLAEESGLWSIYTHISTPTTRTLDKYFSRSTLPKRPRYQNVIKTVEFVLKICPGSSPEHQKLGEMRIQLCRWLGIPEKEQKAS